MPELGTFLPARRTELVIRPVGDEGQYVVKDPRSGEFFHLGEKEYFLLTRLDGVRTADEISLGFAEQFGESLTEDELDEFARSVRLPGCGGSVTPGVFRELFAVAFRIPNG